ncbi:unnamed protein product [Rhodiola kirilowii]
MGRKSAKTRKSKKQKVVGCFMKNNDVRMDYTLLLLESLLHHILSFLSAKDAARCSVLSKRWRHARETSHIVDFDQRCFVGPSNDRFQKFVDNYLLRMLEQKHIIGIFRLTVTSSGSTLASHIDRWLDIAVRNNVKEMELHMHLGKNGYHYSIPLFVLAAKTITAITLDWCKLGLPNVVNLPYLRKLYLKRVILTETMLQTLTLSCPSIERLCLISCNGLVNLEVSTLEQLSTLEVHFCKRIRKIDVVAPKLRSFLYDGYKCTQSCAINLIGCPSLKKLTLKDRFMDDLSFESLISNFPNLEHLVLSKCNAMTNIEIFQAQLKSLVLRGCNTIISGNFHVPQLVSFEYSGACNLLFSFLNPSSLRKAKLQFESMPRGPDFVPQVMFFSKLHTFFSSFDQSRGLKLVMRHKKKIVVYQKLIGLKLHRLSNIIFEVITPSMKLEDLVENLLRNYRPETLSLVVDAMSQKIMLEKVINEVDQKGNLNCCTYRTNKCWRHYLIGSSVEHRTSPIFSDELCTWITSVEGEELPSTTISLAWRKP